MSLVILSAQANPVPRFEYAAALKKAEAGDPEAQLKVVDQLYSSCKPSDYFGWQPECDEKSCSSWLHKAAAKGYAPAQYLLGDLYKGHFGEYCGIERNVLQGIVWLRKSADQNYVCAFMSLAHMYDEGKDVQQDSVEAAKLYQKAAEAGDEHGQRALAKMLAEGRGVSQDTVKAREWGIKAALQGEMGIQRDLSKIYLETSPPDYAEAYYWLKLSNERVKRETSLEAFNKYLSSEQIAALDERVERDMEKFCREKSMLATCKEEK